jgi:hypothetical protein
MSTAAFPRSSDLGDLEHGWIICLSIEVSGQCSREPSHRPWFTLHESDDAITSGMLASLTVGFLMGVRHGNPSA